MLDTQVRTPAKPTRGGLAARIEAATPPNRDRAVDALRAFAILGVILGHWLVTALTAYGDGQLQVTSPLAEMPWLTPLSWVLQTLAIFFFVGGYIGAKGHRAGQSYGSWVRARLGRLLRPVPVLLLAWIPLAVGLAYAGFDGESLRAVLKLVLSPMWFLVVYSALTALTPLIIRLWNRLGPYALAVPAAVVAAVDVTRFGLGGPQWLGWVNLLAGWLVPYLLGVAWARGALNGRRVAAALLGGGATATAALVMYAGYPASMVGVPGTAVSNLNPPTLAAVTFGLAQVGLALLIRDRLARWMRRPRVWAGVAMANLSAMTIFLWHQTAMIIVTVAAAWFGVLPGLHSVPDHPGWALDRLMWLPAFAAVLALAWALFSRFERSGRT